MDTTGATAVTERRAYVVSLIGTIVLAILGVGAALWTGSQAVLMDGLFTMVGIPLSIVSMVVVRLAEQEPTSDFPVGLVQARPLLELFKSLFMAGILVLAILDSVQTLIDGGRALPGAEVFFYAIAAAGGCAFFALLVAWTTRKARSSLTRLELRNWIQDAILSLAIGVVFAVGTWVRHPIVQAFSVYLDQALVIIIGVVFLPITIRTVARSGRELLLGAPNRATRRKALQLITDVVASAGGAGLRDVVVIATGGRLYVTADVIVSSATLDLNWSTALRADAERAVSKRYPQASCWLSFYPAAAG